MTTAYYTTNGGFDAIVIPGVTAWTCLEKEEVLDFINAVETHFDLWEGNENCDIDIDPENYGHVIASRTENQPLQVLDQERWEERLEVMGIAERTYL